MVGPWGSHLIILQHFLTTTVYLRKQLLTKVNVSANKQALFSKTRLFYYFPWQFRLDMYAIFKQILLLPITFRPCHELTCHGHTDQIISKHFRCGLKREKIAQISQVLSYDRSEWCDFSMLSIVCSW